MIRWKSVDTKCQTLWFDHWAFFFSGTWSVWMPRRSSQTFGILYPTALATPSKCMLLGDSLQGEHPLETETELA